MSSIGAIRLEESDRCTDYGSVSMLEVQVGEPLPAAHAADIPMEKLHGYALNPEHADGTHKARVFYSTLAISREDWEHLRAQIASQIQTAPVTEIRPGFNGLRCSVIVEITGLNDVTHRVMTGWRVPDDGSAPHLTTLYVML